nr:MAG TPA: hypothetical protein [Crassvirales sp.]
MFVIDNIFQATNRPSRRQVLIMRVRWFLFILLLFHF